MNVIFDMDGLMFETEKVFIGCIGLCRRNDWNWKSRLYGL